MNGILQENRKRHYTVSYLSPCHRWWWMLLVARCRRYPSEEPRPNGQRRVRHHSEPSSLTTPMTSHFHWFQLILPILFMPSSHRDSSHFVPMLLLFKKIVAYCFKLIKYVHRIFSIHPLLLVSICSFSWVNRSHLMWILTKSVPSPSHHHPSILVITSY